MRTSAPLPCTPISRFVFQAHIPLHQPCKCASTA
jgi:hypothetical protein